MFKIHGEYSKHNQLKDQTASGSYFGVGLKFDSSWRLRIFLFVARSWLDEIYSFIALVDS